MDLEEYRRMQEKDAPTERNENAFDNLVFPNDGLDRKTIVRSLVAQHFRDRESGSIRNEQSDIIRGKGMVHLDRYKSLPSDIYRRQRFDNSSSWCSRGRKDNYSRYDNAIFITVSSRIVID